MAVYNILIKLTATFFEGSIYVMNGSLREEPNVSDVSSPKKMKIVQRVAIAQIKHLLNSSGSLDLARIGITIPIPS